MQIRVVNVFTQSEYAPRTYSARLFSISCLRQREDRSALRQISKNIKSRSLGLLDAPLRFGISAASVCSPQTAILQKPKEVDRIATFIRRFFVHGLVLAPLALGDHVDHLAVHRAALLINLPRQLGFYEDLPYATWTAEASLRDRVSNVEKALQTRLGSQVIHADKFAIRDKLRIIARYQSQITPEEASSIARYAVKYRCGERLWIPRYSTSWRALLA